MKNIIILILLSLSLQSYSQPRMELLKDSIRIKDDSWEWKYKKKIIKTRIPIRNTGSEDLVISWISDNAPKSYHTDYSGVRGVVIRPNKRTNIPISIELDELTGNWSLDIEIFSNDENFNDTLHISGYNPVVVCEGAGTERYEKINIKDKNSQRTETIITNNNPSPIILDSLAPPKNKYFKPDYGYLNFFDILVDFPVTIPPFESLVIPVDIDASRMKEQSQNIELRLYYHPEDMKADQSTLNYNVSIIPNIEVEDNGQIDLGQMKEHKDINTSLSITNTGLDSLFIDTNRSSGCLRFNRSSLAQGEMTPIEISYDPRFDSGNIHKTCYLAFKGYDEDIPIHLVGEVLSTPIPTIETETSAYDFGDIKNDKKRISKAFYFTNPNDFPIIIKSAKTGDGGSYAQYDKEPILPGEKGKITFHQYTQNRKGPFRRTITLRYYLPGCGAQQGIEVIRIQGNIIE